MITELVWKLQTHSTWPLYIFINMNMKSCFHEHETWNMKSCWKHEHVFINMKWDIKVFNSVVSYSNKFDVSFGIESK